MTTERIDVLAVMSLSASDLHGMSPPMQRRAQELREARAAVAELVEAADYVARYVASFSAMTYSPEACKEANDRLTAALARVGGAS